MTTSLSSSLFFASEIFLNRSPELQMISKGIKFPISTSHSSKTKINCAKFPHSLFTREFLNNDVLRAGKCFLLKSNVKTNAFKLNVYSESPKYSKGDAPGEYGGPPLDLRIRKSYGGEAVDPITSQETYIWNADWKKKLDAEKKLLEGEKPAPIKVKKNEDEGFLSLGRALALDSMDVDLSAELNRPSKATLRKQVELARNFSPEVDSKTEDEEEAIKWRYFPSKSDEKKWEKQAKKKRMFVSGEDSLTPAEKLIMEREKFDKLQKDLLLYTLGIGGVCMCCTYVYYSTEIAASYSLGLIGSIVYIRMLSSTVESLGSQNIQGAVKGAVGQPRLLIPVVLVMLFNRWNALIVPEYNAIPLQLIPMLVGFFTYKASTLVQTFKEIIFPLLPEEDKA